MRILSVQRGTVREIAPGTRRAVASAIDKQPVEAIEVTGPGVVGDEIQDPTVHGGEGQAVYLYARSDYAYWEDLLGTELPGGAFGENVTVDSWSDVEWRVGDRLRADEVVLELTGARVPCQKFAARMTELVGPEAGVGWVRRFAAARRFGYYARVVEPGQLAAGDELRRDAAAPDRIGILELMDLYDRTDRDGATVARALASPVDPRIRSWLESLDPTG